MYRGEADDSQIRTLRDKVKNKEGEEATTDGRRERVAYSQR